jgi:peptidoglycan hydrolase-like protein with peptidoglycan-binding domain
MCEPPTPAARLTAEIKEYVMNRSITAFAAILLAAATSFGAQAAQIGAPGKASSSYALAQEARAMSHARVQEVQKALNNSGKSLAVDGRWGTKTQAALRDFQKQNGLKASGRLDRATAQKLNISYS